jgi:TonB family protein
MNRPSCFFILLLYMAWIPAAHAASIEEELDHLLKNQVLSLRYPFARGEMNFDSTGHPLSNPQGRWLVYGAIYVDGVHLSPDTLRLDGRRVALFEKKNSPPTPVALGDAVKVKIQLVQPPSSVDEAQALLNRVFFMGADNLEHAKPEYRRADAGTMEEPLYHVASNNAGVKHPEAAYTPEPEFTEAARRAHVQGTVVFNVVVDKTGQITRIRIVRPLGMGLDEQAVEALKTWRFKPATRNGEPVAVEMNIEVEFRLGR